MFAFFLAFLKLRPVASFKDVTPEGPAVFKSDGWHEIVRHKDETAEDVLWQALPLLIFLALVLALAVFGVI